MSNRLQEAYNIGFTGTQIGMTVAQKVTVLELLKSTKTLDRMGDLLSVHHGMCIGADEEFHQIANFLGFYVYGHPGVDKNGKLTKSFYVPYEDCSAAFVHIPEPYLQRNKKIVDASQILIASPSGYEEELRSGTWSTVRYARKKEKYIVIVYPDGAEEHEN